MTRKHYAEVNQDVKEVLSQDQHSLWLTAHTLLQETRTVGTDE